MDSNTCALLEEMKKATAAKQQAKAAATQPTPESGQPETDVPDRQDGAFDLIVYVHVMILTLSCI